MFNGTGKKGNAISGNAALLSNIKKLGGFAKFKSEIVRVAAEAAVEAHIKQSLASTPAPEKRTKPAPGAIRKATGKSITLPSSKH